MRLLAPILFGLAFSWLVATWTAHVVADGLAHAAAEFTAAVR